jgi:hypothetical protein
MKRARAKAKASRGPKKIKTMDVILLIVAIALLAFTITMIKLFKETGMIPDTLVTCVFAALGGECGAMAWIKTSKERNKEREWQLRDERHLEQLQREAQEKEAINNESERRNNGREDLELSDRERTE